MADTRGFNIHQLALAIANHVDHSYISLEPRIKLEFRKNLEEKFNSLINQELAHQQAECHQEKQALVKKIIKSVLSLNPSCPNEWDEWKDGSYDMQGQVLRYLDHLTQPKEEDE